MSSSPSEFSPFAPTPSETPAPESATPTAVTPSAPALDGLSGEEIEAMVKSAEAAEAAERSVVRLGKITEIRGEDVFVQFDGERMGTVPVTEFTKEAPPVVGQEIHVVIEKHDVSGGIEVLSTRKAEQELLWQNIREGELVLGHVTAMNKGGLEISINGLRAFLPSSQCDTHRMKDISTLLNQDIHCQIIEVNRGKNQIVVSRRHAMIHEREEKRQQLLAQIQEGEVRKGVVGNIAEYGAFVDIGGVDGLLHIREMSWGHVEKPTDIVQSGQEIEVKVLKINRQNGKISLGLKQTKANPWESVDQTYPVGTRVTCKVKRLADFGAFVEICEGLEALIPVSELSWTKRVRNAADVLQENAEVEAVVISVEQNKRRLSLSLRQANVDPWTQAAATYPIDSMVNGKVLRLAEFGAFIQLPDGIEALLPLGHMSEKRINSPSDVVQVGQELQLRVISVDAEKRRISLSLRPAPKAHAPAEPPPGSAKAQAKKKQKPLRGGLSSHWDWTGLGGMKLKS